MSLRIRYAQGRYSGGTPDYLVEIVRDGYLGGRRKAPAYKAILKTRRGKHVLAEAGPLTLCAARRWCRQQATEA